MPDIVYQLLTPQDIELAIDGRIQFLLDLAPNPPTIEIKDRLTEQLRRHFAEVFGTGSYLSYAAFIAGEFAGIGGMIIREYPGNFKNPSGRVGFIVNMYTVPAFRRKGICSSILNKLVEKGKELGIGTFELFATKTGQEVYPQHGFEVHSEPFYRRYSVTI